MIPTDLHNQRAFIRHWAAMLKLNSHPQDRTGFMAGTRFMLRMVAGEYAKQVYAYRYHQRMNPFFFSSEDWRRYVDIESRR